MARISAGLDFGQAVVQPARTQPVDPGPGVAAVASSLERVGAQQQAEGQQLQRQQDAEARQAAREAQAARDAAERGTAQARMIAMRDSVSDELERIGQEVQEGRLPKTDATKAWQDRTAKILADNIEGVPEVHRGAVQADLQALTGRLSSKVGDIVRKRDQTDTLGAITQVQEYTQRLAVTEPDKARQIWLDTVDQLGPFAGLQPDQIAKSKQGWIEGTSYTRAFTAVNAAKADNKALAAVERGINENPDLDPQRKATLLAQVDNYRVTNETRAINAARNAEIAAAAAQRRSSAAMDRLGMLMSRGVTPDPAYASVLLKDLTPADAVAYRAMAADAPTRVAIAAMPFDRQDRELDALRSQYVKAATPELEKAIKLRETIAQEQRKAYADEPLRAGNEYGVIALKPLNTSGVDTIAAGLVERVSQAQQVAGVTRGPVSPLLAEEAQKLGGILQALPVTQRAERLSQIAALMPAGQAQALARQIYSGQTESGKALGLALALGTARTTYNRPTAELALRGAEALKAKTIKEERTPVDGWRGQINTQLAGAYPNPQQAEMYGEAARLILAGLVAEGANGTADDAKQAVRLAIGGSLVEHNGVRIPVPAEFGAEDIRRRTRAMTPADLAPQLPDGRVYINRVPMDPTSFLSALPDAKLQYAGRGKYHVITGGTFAANANGDPVVIEVRK